jgi:hypothetical protein
MKSSQSESRERTWLGSRKRKGGQGQRIESSNSSSKERSGKLLTNEDIENIF